MLKRAATRSRFETKLLCLSGSWRIFLFGIAGLLFSLSIHLSHLPFWHDHPEFYYDGDKPLMTTLDAYYYLRLASSKITRSNVENNDETTETRRSYTPSPLLASLAAFLQRLCGLPIERVAFFLPPLLGSFMVLIYGCWGHAVAGPAMALTASLAGLSSFYWYGRTCLGRFDTDCLNPVFVFLILFLTYRFTVGKGRSRRLYFAASIFSAYLLHIWWRQLPYFGFFLILLPYCLSVYLASSRLEKIVKISGLFVLTGILIGILTGHYGYLPDGFKRTTTHYLQQYALVRNQSSVAAAFPGVGPSISELQPVSLAGMATAVGGHPITFLLALIGFCLLLKEKKETACFLLAGAGLASLSLLSRRFLIFVVPLYALGFGFLFAGLWALIRRQDRPTNSVIKPALCIVSALLCLGLLWPNIHRSVSMHRPPPLTASDVLLARSIVAEEDAKAVVWSWWDYGYFLEYLTGLRVFIDGGSQSPERTFIAAFPLACDDPVLAGNWLRFFAAHDVTGWNELTAALGSAERAFRFLKEVFAQPGIAPDIIRTYGLDETFSRQEYLFPETKVFLFLNSSLLQKTYWWYFFGTWNPIQGTGSHPRFWMDPSGRLELLRQTGSIAVERRQVRVEKMVEMKRDGVETTNFKTISSSHQEHIGCEVEKQKTAATGNLIALKILNDETLYVLEPPVLQSLSFRLSAMSPLTTPGFTPLTFEAGKGGVWSAQ